MYSAIYIQNKLYNACIVCKRRQVFTSIPHLFSEYGKQCDECKQDLIAASLQLLKRLTFTKVVGLPSHSLPPESFSTHKFEKDDNEQ